MAEYSKPLPIPDIDSQQFWDGCKAGKFLMRHCNACDRDYYYPRPFCPTCWSDDVSWREASGRGTVLVRRLPAAS